MQKAIEEWLMPEAQALTAKLDASTGPGFARLNAAITSLMDDWSMVAFCPLDYSDEDSIAGVLAQVRCREEVPSVEKAHTFMSRVCSPCML